MAIPTINYDENNNPTRSKYRIIVLENLNNNDCGKCDTYAPVLNQTETHLLTVLTMRSNEHYNIAT